MPAVVKGTLRRDEFAGELTTFEAGRADSLEGIDGVIGYVRAGRIMMKRSDRKLMVR